jgi:hypothetical protein
MASFHGPLVKLVLSATGTSEEITNACSKHAVQLVKVDGGTPGAFSATLQGTLDGSNWVNIGTAISSASITQFEGVYRAVRVNLATLAAGDNLMVTYAGIE